MHDSEPDRDLRFGRVVVRPAARQLVVDGRVVPVGARAFDVLVALVERRDRVVGKDELLELVWPGLVVEENNLQVQVSALRKALGADAIATVPGRGYRFALSRDGDASDEAELPPAPQPARRSRRFAILVGVGALVAVGASTVVWRIERPQPEPPGIALRSAVVLPFSAPAGDTRLAAVGAGLAADVARALGDSMRHLQVVAPDAAASHAAVTTDPKAIGRATRARFVVQGELRPTGELVELTLRLIDAVDGRQPNQLRESLDSGRFVEQNALGRRLAARTQGMLQATIAGIVAARGEAAANAQDLVDLSHAISLRDAAAVAHEKRRLAGAAIKREPKLARAWTLRALAGTDLFFTDFALDTESLVDDVDADSFRAITLDSRDPVAWVARSHALRLRGNMAGALAALDRARELAPDHFGPLIARGWLYLDLGKPEETMKIALQLREAFGPHSSLAAFQACAAHLFTGAYDAAIAECERMEASMDAWQMHATLAAAHAMRGDFAKAAQARDRLLKTLPTFRVSRYEARINAALTPEGRAMEREHFTEGLRRAGVPD